VSEAFVKSRKVMSPSWEFKMFSFLMLRTCFRCS
jgi:hypothetical protein